MYVTVTTTITTEIDIDTLTPKHSVEIDASDELPTQVIYAAVQGACKATLNTIRDQGHALPDEEDDDA